MINNMESTLRESEIRATLPSKDFHDAASWHKLKTRQAQTEKNVEKDIIRIARGISRGEIDKNTIHPKLLEEIKHMI